MDETKGQPTLMSIQTACLHFGGPLLTCRAFRQCGPRPLRGIANSEFTEAVNALEQAGLGKVRSVRVRFAPHPVQVFKCQQMYLYRYQAGIDRCELHSTRNVPRCLDM